jgi:hypothetical protein
MLLYVVCSNIPEADAPWHRLLRVQRLQLCPEQVSREPETAGRLVKDGDQVVRDDVTIRICNIFVHKMLRKFGKCFRYWDSCYKTAK